MGPAGWTLLILAVLAILLVILIWFIKTQILRERNANRTIVQRPASFTRGANSNAAAPYLPFNSPYPPNPPPLGFGDPVDMPQPDLHNTHPFNSNNHVNTYPPKSQRAPYPLHSESRAPYPTETSCYPPPHITAPYPIDSSMPQPSASRNAYYSDGNDRDSSNSIRITPYPPAHQAPYPPSDEFLIPRPSTSRTPRFRDNATDQGPASRKRVLYLSENSAPYPPSRRAPYPPAGSATFSAEHPPSYEDAVNNKF